MYVLLYNVHLCIEIMFFVLKVLKFDISSYRNTDTIFLSRFLLVSIFTIFSNNAIDTILHWKKFRFRRRLFSSICIFLVQKSFKLVVFQTYFFNGLFF